MRLAALAVIALALSLVLSPALVQAAPTVPRQAVVLQALDKVTARISVLEVPLDREVTFGTLAIRPRACLQTPPTEAPESAAFLEIRATDREPGQDEAFTGWMFASTPAISALEHPVYDVWVIDCGDAAVTGESSGADMPVVEAPAGPVVPPAAAKANE